MSALPIETAPVRAEPFDPTTSSSVVASICGATKSFRAARAVEDISLEIRQGEVLALLGHNGAGKTTTIRMLLGLTKPDQGAVQLFGRSPSDISVKRRIGVMLQSAELSGTLRVFELIDLVSSYYPAPIPSRELLAMTSLAWLASRSYSGLSGGERRLVQFALAICGRPQLIFLDEPSAGLDIEAREAMWSCVRSLVGNGCSVVLTTHQLEEAEVLADRMIVLSEGRVVAEGSLESLRGKIARTRVSAQSSLTCAEVSRWPGVQDASRDGRRIVVYTTDGTATARTLLATDPHAQNIEIKEGGLIEIMREYSLQRGARS